ncbi:metallophosphoesterase family protein [Alkalibacter mobilis]|uniref:metallophosphoesterase family protein n=1 Tax=Alkalibacter mobilis TaxID=2787712 RepID=UPI0018A03A3C|nr:metallophosphoesterase [Alkalibacter mobilis]MBF7097255.1 metallophosphoesterase [Alkalibacter mobilis]
MNILVFSDSHRNTGRMEKVVENSENIDLIIHLGDNAEDVDKIKDLTDARIVLVKGNTDYTNHEEELVLKEKGYRILLTHGHKYRIKTSLQNLFYRCKELKIDIVLFGHSHIPSNEEIGGIIFLNPGSIGDKRGQKYHSYGKITLRNKGLDVAISYLE